jgi:imidazolonepropionase
MTDESGAKRIIFRGYQLLTLQVDHQPYGWLADAALVTRGPIIEWIGPQRELPAYDGDVQIQEGHGRFLSPGLIDCHTHLVYGGDRSAEWEQRLIGVSYEEIARRGGGILSTVKATREASEDELFASASQRVSAFLKQGVTAIEIKSGYGLNLDTERKMLRVARRIEQHFPVHVSKTLLAAHALPPEYNGRADDYIDHICEGMLPALIGMVDAVDIFCESIAFNPQQMQRVFAAARQLNPQIQLKAHVEQLSNLGGARRAAQMGALSVDHIEYLSATDCAILAEHGTVATLLPGAFLQPQGDAETARGRLAPSRCADCYLVRREPWQFARGITAADGQHGLQPVRAHTGRSHCRPDPQRRSSLGARFRDGHTRAGDAGEPGDLGYSASGRPGAWHRTQSLPGRVLPRQADSSGG